MYLRRDVVLKLAVANLGKGDPSFTREVTEGRWQPGKYQWCGDYVTYILMQAGCKDGEALNRASLNGKWYPGDNMTRLKNWADKHGATLKPSEKAKFQPGDVFVIQRKAGGHTGFIERQLDSGHWSTIDGNSLYGRVARNTRTFSDVLWVVRTSLLSCTDERIGGPPAGALMFEPTE